MYRLIRNLLFYFEPEKVHHFSMDALRMICSIPALKQQLGKGYAPAKKEIAKTVFGLEFKNPVGLAAGFDKNALWLNELETLGFGFVEIGTVTPLPQDGNEKPRLFRIAEDQALINRMGFNNHGVKAVADRLRKWKADQLRKKNGDAMIIGGNIGKNKATPNDEAWRDYEKCFIGLFDYVDYFVVNVSSPNTPGLRELQDKESLRKILAHLQAINNTKPVPKPLLLKISPDLSNIQLDDIVDLARELKLDGIVATNTTISREKLTVSPERIEKLGAGGLSGKPVSERSDEVVKYIYDKTRGEIPLIGSGGIFDAADANRKLSLGADLVQVWTGFIYRGPAIVKDICSGLTIDK